MPGPGLNLASSLQPGILVLIDLGEVTHLSHFRAAEESLLRIYIRR